MTESLHSDAFAEQVALYALGVLEAQAAEHVATQVRRGGKVGTQELEAMERVVEMLGYHAPLVRPRPNLRQRLFDRLEWEGSMPAADASLPDAVSKALTSMRHDASLGNDASVCNNDSEWVEFCPGVSIKLLSVDAETQRQIALVRMGPGAQLPPHQHVQDEEVFVLSGDCHIDPDHVLYAGDYSRAAAGSWHDMTTTREGTTFLTLFRNDFDSTLLVDHK